MYIVKKLINSTYSTSNNNISLPDNLNALQSKKKVAQPQYFALWFHMKKHPQAMPYPKLIAQKIL